MIRRSSALIGLFIMGSSALASTPDKPPMIKSVVEMPIQRFQAVETESEVFFMSGDGRYVFRGTVIDTWHKQKLLTRESVEYSANHIDLQKMGLDRSRLNIASVGSGESRVTIFVDPQCGYCKQLIKDAAGHADRYTFDFVIVPALGDASNTLSYKAYCAAEKSLVLSSLQNGTLSSLVQKEKCDRNNYDFTLTFAQMLNIRSVPYVISPDGRYRYGATADFWQWLSDSGKR